MKHSSIVIFDSFIRGAWYSNAMFPLSDALHRSAKMGSLRRQQELFHV
jgi:hypothetical protein